MMGADIVIPTHCPISAAFLMPLPDTLLYAPLDYIAAEHARQRCVCAYLKQMSAERTAARADAEAIVAFMTKDLCRHHEDEDSGLFPALRKRARAEDGLDEILDRLAHDHAAIDCLAAAIVAALRQKLEGAEPPTPILTIDDAASAAMATYAATQLKHLSVENNIALVLARKRLTSGDLASLSQSMIERRQGAVRV